MLKIDNLTKRYAKSDKIAVNNLTLELKEGEIFGFLGPNGAGKSTTIKCITGILPYTEGKISVCGFDINENPIDAKRCIGYVPDTHVIYDKLTGLEYINFMCDVYRVDPGIRKERYENLIKLFELESAINNQIKSYSHGMKQKISIIGALMSNPKLWILDEPLTGLDPQSSYELKKLMRQHVEAGNTVFFSSHVLDVVEKLCDRVGIINNGELITVCTIKELKDKRADLSLEDFFLSITSKDEHTV